MGRPERDGNGTDGHNGTGIQLSRRRVGFCLATVGLYAMNAGDRATAHEYSDVSIRNARDAHDWASGSIGLRKLTACLCWLAQREVTGYIADALDIAVPRACL
jgi:hypothetical protein